MAAARDITTRVGDRTLTLTNLDKVLYPSVGFTKAEVIDYYLRIAPVMLPHIRDRVMTRLRFPDGVGADRFSFYEKNAPMGTPDWVRRVNVNTSDGIIDYVVADDEPAIAWLANLAALEMHVPQWTVGSATLVDNIINLPELRPRTGEPLADRVVVDLDPGAGMTIVESARAALIVAAKLAEDGMIPIAQTSGSKGIQVYADYNQNLAARNTIAPYSMRGRERPAVATPVTWEELGSVRSPDDLRFAPDEVLARVDEFGDLARDLLTSDPPPLPDEG